MDDSTQQQITVLPQTDQNILIKSQESNLKTNEKLMIICLLFFWTIFGLIVGIALWILCRKLRTRLNMIKNGPLTVSSVTGIMTTQNGGRALSIITVGDTTLPEVVGITIMEKSGLAQCRGEIITADYLPDCKLNWRYFSSSGTGYNFITKEIL